MGKSMFLMRLLERIPDFKVQKCSCGQKNWVETEHSSNSMWHQMLYLHSNVDKSYFRISDNFSRCYIFAF